MQTAQGEEEVSEEEYEEMSEEDYAYFEVRVIQADWEREREAILDLTRARAAVPPPAPPPPPPPAPAPAPAPTSTPTLNHCPNPQAQAEATKQQELSPEAKKVYSGMRSSSGVEFAPWMQVDPEAIAKAEKMRLERKARQAAQKEVDPLAIDPQAAELGAGGGLRSKTISEEEVELRWSTGNEDGNAGFIVQRRKGGTEKFEDIASFDSYAALKTKGSAGGSYTYLDDTVPSVGTWVYRVLDCDTKGTRSAVCQKLVEVDSQDEQTFTLAVGGVIAVLALGLVVAGIGADPIQTTSAGRNVGFF